MKAPALGGRSTRQPAALTPPPTAAHPATPRPARNALAPRGLTEKIVWRPVGALKPFPNNPRCYAEARVARFMRTIEKIWTSPTLTAEPGTPLGGPARLEAAKRLALI